VLLALLAQRQENDDVEDDGSIDVLLGGNENQTCVYNRTGGEIILFDAEDDIGYYFGHGDSPAVRTGDITGDGIPEVVYGSKDTQVYVARQVGCTIDFTDGSYNMTWNKALKIWEYSRSFTAEGQKQYNITCDKGGYAQQSTATSINVSSDCDYFCDSCSNCTSKVAAAAYGETVCLTQDTEMTSGQECIYYDEDHGVNFDCQGNTLLRTLGGTTYGIYINQSGYGSDNLTISNCNISGFSSGIYGVYAEGDTFTDLSISNNEYYGIYLLSSGDNSIVNTVIENAQINGIRIANSNYINITNTVIRNCSRAVLLDDGEFRLRDVNITTRGAGGGLHHGLHHHGNLVGGSFEKRVAGNHAEDDGNHGVPVLQVKHLGEVRVDSF